MFVKRAATILWLVLGWFASASPAQIEVRLGLLPIESVRIVPGLAPAVTCDHPASASGELLFGDIVPLRLILTNVGSTPSKPVYSGLASGKGLSVTVRANDGTELLVLVANELDCHYYPSHPLEPGQSIVINFFVVARSSTHIDQASDLTDSFERYVFPKPGEYTIECEVHAFHNMQLRWEDQPAPLLTNTVRVRVGEPYRGWDTLEAADIVQTLRQGRKLGTEQIDIESLDRAVRSAGRAWLANHYPVISPRDEP